MPVNTAALKTFAPAMRRQLLEAVGRKLDLLLHSQTPDTLSTYAKQISELREQEAENRDQLLERVAYTWFNRLSALRYLDARGWHPFGCKVLMPGGEGETQPELLKLMRAGSMPAELKPHTNEARLHGLLDGQIPPAIAGADPQGEVYRELVLASCRSYHQLLPELFEGLDDASELLLPDDLLSEGSIAGGFRSAISDEDCQDVEILGWLYQFYIAEKKDEVMARKKAVPSDDVPAVTQLFTPHWIVRYLVENSLGRLWLRSRPDSSLKAYMPYYVHNSGDQDINDGLIISSPEDIRILDPACGSGHMLVYAFELLTRIYEEAGYSPREIPVKILECNLYGVDICPRATQLASLALKLKAREHGRAAFRDSANINILTLQSIKPSATSGLREIAESAGITHAEFQELTRGASDLSTLGTLSKIKFGEERANLLITRLSAGADKDIFNEHGQDLLRKLLKRAQFLGANFHVVVGNPPYMGRSGMTDGLKRHLQSSFKNSKNDLCTSFMEMSESLLLPGGFLSMVTLQAWMTLGSFAAFRHDMLTRMQIETLVKIGFNSFPELNSKVALACAMVACKASPSRSSKYFDLNTDNLSDDKESVFLSAVSDGRYFERDQRQFLDIPGTPVAFDAPESLYLAFKEQLSIGSQAPPRVGMQTSDNSSHLRLWWEVNLSEIKDSLMSASPKWIRYIKGGGYRKWYGNDFYILFYDGTGQRILETPNATLMLRDRIDAPKCTWTDIALAFNCRLAPDLAAHDISGHCMYPPEEDIYLILSYANSSVFRLIIDSLNGTLHYQVGDVAKVPFRYPDNRSHLESLSKRAVEICTDDWNERETSRAFMLQPILSVSPREDVAASLEAFLLIAGARREELRSIEEANNLAWADAFAFADSVRTNVSDKELSLSLPDCRALVLEILSYSIGCMMGRYSLDHPGFILADSRDNQAEQLTAYEEKVGKPLSEAQFKPDPDGIIPVLDGEWFEDDIVARTREFLTVTFPENSVAENLRFIEESLGKDIRKYFCSDFYKDHLQTYKKRPIYWMVQSPKRGFACLIYLHRYTKDTLNQVLNNYFRPYLQKLEARLAQLGLDQLNDDLPARERTAARKEAEKITKVLKECQAWEQDALLPLAQQRIELDLDDGVKVNYLKLQDVLAPIPGLAAKED